MSTFLFSVFLIISPQLIRGTKQIVVGSNADENKFNSYVHIRWQNIRVSFCAGSILNKFWVLTAAQCVYQQQPDHLTVVPGSKSLKEGGDFYDVEKFSPHPLYNHATQSNDIALMKLKTPIIWGIRVQPIRLSPVSPKAGDVVVLAGWGAHPLRDNSDNLKMIHFSCHITIIPYGPEVPLVEICTWIHVDQETYRGDSGSPLVKEDVQVGVMSYGVPCAKGRSDIYTDVSFYLNWIMTESGYTDR